MNQNELDQHLNRNLATYHQVSPKIEALCADIWAETLGQKVVQSLEVRVPVAFMHEKGWTHFDVEFPVLDPDWRPLSVRVTREGARYRATLSHLPACELSMEQLRLLTPELQKIGVFCALLENALTAQGL